MKKSMILVISIFVIIFLGLGIISTKKYYENKVYSNNLEKSSEEVLKNFTGTSKEDRATLLITGSALWTDGNKELAIKYFEKAYELGSAGGAEKLYQAYTELGDEEKKKEWELKGAEMGVDWIQYNLGNYYKKSGNLEEAEKWYLKSAEQGYINAQYNLGNLYTKLGNIKKAEYWYLKAAEREDGDAQYNLGNLYKRQNNIEKAKYWYKKAYNNGINDAKNEIN